MTKNTNHTYRQTGFTLFELLVSISIIGILTALAILSFSGAQKKARDAKRIDDMKSLQQAAEQYYSLNNYQYPANYPSTYTSTWTVGAQTIMSVMPSDPKNTGSYVYNCTTGSATGYCCCALLENLVGNSSSPNCAFVTSGGQYQCVQNQQ